MIWPYLDVTPSRRFADRRFAITVFLLLISFVTILSYMGLAKFGVKTSADAEVLHDMTYPPQHNHMGTLLPVPYDQLVPGQYTTVQVVAEEDNPSDPNAGASAVNAFNEYVDTTVVPVPPPATGTATIESLLTTSLNLVALPVTSLTFVPTPADAPELHEALSEYQDLIDASNKELLNAWGTVVISQNQNDLRRVDVTITWDEVQLDGGIPVLDDQGNPIPILDENGNPIRRLNSTHIFIHKDGGYFAH